MRGILRFILSNILVLTEDISEQVSAIKFTIFGRNQIVSVLKNISTEKTDYLKSYEEGSIYCAVCKKMISPKSDSGSILGGIISEGDNIQFLCSNITCYERALRKK